SARGGPNEKSTERGRRGSPRSVPLEGALQSDEENLRSRRQVRAPVSLPAAFAVVGAHRTILTEADNGKMPVGNTHRSQGSFRGFRPAIAQRNVVFLRAALVAMTFNQQLLIGIVGQNLAD